MGLGGWGAGTADRHRDGVVVCVGAGQVHRSESNETSNTVKRSEAESVSCLCKVARLASGLFLVATPCIPDRDIGPLSPTSGDQIRWRKPIAFRFSAESPTNYYCQACDPSIWEPQIPERPKTLRVEGLCTSRCACCDLYLYQPRRIYQTLYEEGCYRRLHAL